MAAPYNLTPETATVIAHLSTAYGSLPQGAPTSPVLSNMVCSRMDRELQELARRKKAVYTRYADDITLSFGCKEEKIPESVVDLSGVEGGNYVGAKPGYELEAIIQSNGFRINSDKTRLQAMNERQVVTGLTVNKKVNVDRRFVRKTRSLIHSIESYGLNEADRFYKEKVGDENKTLSHYIQGRLLFIKQVKGVGSDVYKRLAERFNFLSLGVYVPIVEKREGDTFSHKFGEVMAKRCWILEEDENVLCQASGFMINNQYIITCAHFFSKRGF